MTQRRQNFMGGAAILAGAVAVTKLLGALYKIPLGNLLDSEGMAHFYAAYNIYSLLLVLSTAGLPAALSRMVSRAAAQRRFGAVRKSLRIGLALLAGLTEGDRLVGIISHVSALKDRIDRQVVVHKNRTGGSTVELVV